MSLKLRIWVDSCTSYSFEYLRTGVFFPSFLCPYLKICKSLTVNIFKRNGVDAISPMLRGGTIIEDVAEVGMAAAAKNFVSLKVERPIL